MKLILFLWRKEKGGLRESILYRTRLIALTKIGNNESYEKFMIYAAIGCNIDYLRTVIIYFVYLQDLQAVLIIN